MTSYYQQARDGEALYVVYDKEYDTDGAKEQVMERLQEEHEGLGIDEVLEIDRRFIDRLVEAELINMAEDEYFWLKEAIDFCKPKSMYKADRRWVGRDESVLYQNQMFEIRLHERDCDYIIIFALRSDYEGYYTDEIKIRNLAVGKLHSHAKAFFNRMHEGHGFDLRGNVYDFIYRDGLTQREQDKRAKKLTKPNGVKSTIKVGSDLVTFFDDKFQAPTITPVFELGEVAPV